MFADKLTVNNAWLDEATLVCQEFTEEEIRECIKAQRKQEQELTKAASAGLFLTAADLRDE